MSDTMELYYAEMEAARNESEKAYFGARPHLAKQVNSQKLFRAGFERAFEPLWNRLVSLERQRDLCAGVAGKALKEIVDGVSDQPGEPR
jgi:hypothetical protein